MSYTTNRRLELWCMVAYILPGIREPRSVHCMLRICLGELLLRSKMGFCRFSHIRTFNAISSVFKKVLQKPTFSRQMQPVERIESGIRGDGCG